MSPVLDASLSEFLATIAPEPDPIQAEMADRAEREGFPIVGPTVGGVFYQLAMMLDATRVFEFGSGFGYSGYWFARALPPGGQLVLTEHDADELADARAYFERADFQAAVAFEEGDAMATIDRYEGPFDLVLIDHQKERYVDAFETVADQVPPGGVVLADNAITAGSLDSEGIMQGVLGGDVEQLDAASAAIVEYLQTIRDHEAFIAGVLPIGSGVAVAVRRRD